MRPLMSVVICFLVLAAGPDASAWGGWLDVTWTTLRPGNLHLKAEDGRLAMAWQSGLDGDDAEVRKNILASIVEADDALYFQPFRTSVTLSLSARVPNGSYFIIHSLRPDEIFFHFYITPPYRYKADDFEKLLKSAVITVNIDDWRTEADKWEVLPGEDGLIKDYRDFLLFPDLSRPLEETEEFWSGFLAALETGRVMTVQTDFDNGDSFTAEFDLSGLGEAMDQFRQKCAEIDQTVRGQVEEFKKRLEALNQLALSNEAAAEGSGPVRTGN